MKQIKINLFYSIIISCLFVWYLFVASRFNLTPDEAYYWLWSQNLSFWYIDHPPLIAWLIAPFAYLSKSELFIRMPAVIIGTILNPILLLMIVKQIEVVNNRIILFLILFPVWILIGAASSFLITPDIPLIFFCILSILLLIKQYSLNSKKRLTNIIFFGVVAGLIILSKHTGILWLFIIFIISLCIKDLRLSFREYFIAILISFLIGLPYWYIEIVNNFAGIKLLFGFHIYQKLKSIDFQIYIPFFSWFFSQVGILSPLVAFEIGKVIFRPPQPTIEKFLWLIGIIFLSFCAFVSLFISVEANWSVPAYLPLLILLIKKWQSEWKQKKIWICSVVISGFCFVLICYLHLFFNILSIPSQQDPSGRLKGWEQLSDINFNEKIFVASNYELFSEMSYYGRNDLKVYLSNEDLRIVSKKENINGKIIYGLIFQKRPNKNNILKTIKLSNCILDRDSFNVIPLRRPDRRIVRYLSVIKANCY